MTKLTSFAGIDVSKDFFDVCLLTMQETTKSQQFCNDAKGFAAFAQWLKECDAVHCVMEVTGPLLSAACLLPA